MWQLEASAGKQMVEIKSKLIALDGRTCHSNGASSPCVISQLSGGKRSTITIL
jgi:hypothetical protein